MFYGLVYHAKLAFEVTYAAIMKYRRFIDDAVTFAALFLRCGIINSSSFEARETALGKEDRAESYGKWTMFRSSSTHASIPNILKVALRSKFLSTSSFTFCVCQDRG